EPGLAPVGGGVEVRAMLPVVLEQTLRLLGPPPVDLLDPPGVDVLVAERLEPSRRVEDDALDEPLAVEVPPAERARRVQPFQQGELPRPLPAIDDRERDEGATLPRDAASRDGDRLAVLGHREVGRLREDV